MYTAPKKVSQVFVMATFQKSTPRCWSSFVSFQQSLHSFLRGFFIIVSEVADYKSYCRVYYVRMGVCTNTNAINHNQRDSCCTYVHLLVISGSFLTALLYKAVKVPPSVKKTHVLIILNEQMNALSRIFRIQIYTVFDFIAGDT